MHIGKGLTSWLSFVTFNGTVFLLLIQSRRQRFQNATSLNKEFRNGIGVRIPTQNERNSLHEFGLNARRPAVCVPLKRQHLQNRLDFVLFCVCYFFVRVCLYVLSDHLMGRTDLLALVCGVYCEFVTFPLVSWIRCGTWLYRFLIFAPLLTFPELTSYGLFVTGLQCYFWWVIRFCW